jgi:hypothetical protein
MTPGEEAVDDPVIVEVEELVIALFAALSTGDLAWFEQHLLLDDAATHIGVGRAHWRTSAELVHGLQEQFESEPSQWRAVDPVYLHRGDAVCVADRPVISFDDGSELPCRVTLLFVREPTWKLAHTHLSVGS